jgi:thiol-disulfide isomerase/thioredoxin
MENLRMKPFLKSLLLTLLLTLPIAAQNSTTKLEGQVVCCAECWGQADRTKVEFGTAEDLLKAKSCVEGGDPTLLAVREGDNFKLYQLATGKFRLPGKNWLEFVGKRVAVQGTIQAKTDHSIIRVDSLQVVAPSLAERQAQKTLGQEIDLRLKDLSGVEQSLAGLKGRVVILNFWATYCIPCRTEMPDLAAIQNEFAPLGVQVIGVSTDDLEERNAVLKFIRETKVNFPIWVGGSATQMIRFGLGAALPGTVIIGRDGRVAKVISGVIDRAALRKDVETLLATTTPSNEKATGAPEKQSARAVSTVPS